jgi:hypothetical protein
MAGGLALMAVEPATGAVAKPGVPLPQVTSKAVDIAPAASATTGGVRIQRFSLAGKWRAALLHPLPQAESYEKSQKVTPASPEAQAAAKPGFDDSAWAEVELPASWDRLGGEWARSDGEAAFRRTIDLAPELAGREFEIRLGPIDDIDEVWINGVRIGGTGREAPGHWAKPRIYRIKPGVLKAGSNLVVVRVVDLFSNGGFTGGRDDMELRTRN